MTRYQFSLLCCYVKVVVGTEKPKGSNTVRKHDFFINKYGLNDYYFRCTYITFFLFFVHGLRWASFNVSFHVAGTLKARDYEMHASMMARIVKDNILL